MRRPSDKTIDKTVAKIDKHLTDLDRRLKAANKIDRRGGTPRQRDGYPKGAGGVGATNEISRPTESAMLAGYRTPRGDDGPGQFVTPADPVRDFFERAWAHMQKAEVELAIVVEQLKSIDALGIGVPEPEPCEPCFVFDRHAAMEYFGDVGGRLDHKMRLCAWHRWQVHRYGGLPAETKVHSHHDGVVRIDPTKAASRAKAN